MVHQKCRGENYSFKTPEGELRQVARFPVPEDKVLWTEAWAEYSPEEFTADFVKEAVWADPEIEDAEFVPKWNTLDGNVSDTVDKFMGAFTRNFVCRFATKILSFIKQKLPDYPIT